jgi:hypothetical protein
MNRDELQEHVFSTYVTLRFGVAAVALAFPVLLYVVGRFVHGIDLENSMSNYYFSLAPDDLSKRGFPMRAWFAGLLFAIGVFLYLYKGFSDKENIALNFAGLFALGVALFPMNWECSSHCSKVNPHATFAVLLFLCIAFVSLTCAKDTLHLLNNPPLEASFLRKYRLLGALMIASPLVAMVITFLLQDLKKYVFFVEAAGVWAFALYWWVKSQELSLSGAEKKALATG